jgi:membrane protein YdbS with pleckstrin-like domain
VVTSAGEWIRLAARPHGVVLARPLAKAVGLASVGGLLVALGWPATPLGALLLVISAVLALRAVWRWDRTCVLVTSERLVLVTGTLRRRSSSVPLASVRRVELEQGFLGRMLGYGTVVAGELEISYVADAVDVCALVRRPNRRTGRDE